MSSFADRHRQWQQADADADNDEDRERAEQLRQALHNSPEAERARRQLNGRAAPRSTSR